MKLNSPGMVQRSHALAGALSMLLIAGFWISSVAVEILAGAQAIAWVKAVILALVPILVACLVTAGISGAWLMRIRPSALARRKQRRMALAAASGLLLLVPSAWLLADWSAGGRFDAVFYAVQFLELGAGALNLALLGLNLRDGLRMRRARLYVNRKTPIPA